MLVHCLSMFKVCPKTVQYCKFPTDQEMKFVPVQSMSKSNVCPIIVQSKEMQSNNILLDKVWTYPWFPCPMTVQDPLNWTGSLHTLDRLCIWLDIPCTFPSIGQTFDRVWTEIGQTLDFVSNSCPTNHWEGVPKSPSERSIKVLRTALRNTELNFV